MAFFERKKTYQKFQIIHKICFRCHAHKHIIIGIRHIIYEQYKTYFNKIPYSLYYLAIIFPFHIFSFADINQSTSQRFPYFMHRKHIIQLRKCSKTINRVYRIHSWWLSIYGYSLKSSII